MEVQGGRGDMYKVWHLIWRQEHVCWSCCVEAHRGRPLIPRWPSELCTLPDYMSELVRPAKQPPGCRRGAPMVASYFSLHVISWTEFSFQPVRLRMITADSERLLVSVSTHKCPSAGETMRLVPFLFAF